METSITRVLALLESELAFDPQLTWGELHGLMTAVLEFVLDEPVRARALDFLELNMPGARLRELIDWPGEWFGNRWMEEIVLGPEEVALYALARSGREVPGLPFEPELPFPLPDRGTSSSA